MTLNEPRYAEMASMACIRMWLLRKSDAIRRARHHNGDRHHGGEVQAGGQAHEAPGAVLDIPFDGGGGRRGGLSGEAGGIGGGHRRQSLGAL